MIFKLVQFQHIVTMGLTFVYSIGEIIAKIPFGRKSKTNHAIAQNGNTHDYIIICKEIDRINFFGVGGYRGRK
jgi:hypothetical protein